MLSRSTGVSVSLRVATTVASPLPSMSRRMAVWISSSIGTTDPIASNVDQRVRVARFIDQNIERRHVLVPFDQGRHRPEPAQTFLVERPHLVDHARAVIVNTQRGASASWRTLCPARWSSPTAFGGNVA